MHLYDFLNACLQSLFLAGSLFGLVRQIVFEPGDLLGAIRSFERLNRATYPDISHNRNNHLDDDAREVDLEHSAQLSRLGSIKQGPQRKETVNQRHYKNPPLREERDGADQRQHQEIEQGKDQHIQATRGGHNVEGRIGYRRGYNNEPGGIHHAHTVERRSDSERGQPADDNGDQEGIGSGKTSVERKYQQHVEGRDNLAARAPTTKALSFYESGLVSRARRRGYTVPPAKQ